MQALLVLLRAQGRTVTRDQFVDACWDGRIVSDDAISRVIALVRGIERQFDPPPFHLETIPKIGFRLKAAEYHTDPAAPAAVGDGGTTPAVASRWAAFSRRWMVIAVAASLLMTIAAVAWLWFRPAPAAAHSMMVRLSGFRALSADLPATMRDTINAEIAAAFNVDGVIGVSSAPTPGSVPGYSLDGTIYRVGPSIRVITRLTNERSGVVLWSDTVDYAADQVSKIPHKIAVDAGTVVRCGLSGAATYREPLPDPVLSNYMQYCQEYWAYGGTKTLRFAQRVVAAVPDFSWGWSAVGNGFMQAAHAEHDSRRAEEMRAAGRQAEDKALALDPDNSEALAHKAYLIDPRDWVAQEALFKRAIAAKPLDCGCEHYGYGLKLESVGRLGAAIEQFRAATDMLALWPDSQLALASALVAAGRGEQASWPDSKLALASALVATGRGEQARSSFDAAIDLSKDLN
ncbi:MAG: hypothetical protein ACREEG_13370, partial [Phenylobacterium sp.]